MATINGTSAANLILGTNDNDIVNGLGGNDVFQDSAAASDDLFDGGIGNDTINYVNATGAVTISLALDGVAQFTGGAGTDTLISVENATGSNFNDLLVGSNGINILNGGLGDDILDGGLGNDVLYGAGGNDTYIIYAGSGEDDILDSGGTNDVLLIQGNLFDDVWDMWRQGNNLFVQMSNGTPQGGEIVVLFNHFTTAGRIETITDTDGNTFNLTNGTAGSAGNDVMVGGSANETFNGFGGDDVIQADLGHDTASGGLGNDVIYGLAGNDTLNGDDGNDLIYGDHGNDVISGGAGNDVMFGGELIDTASYATAADGVTVSLAIAGAQNTVGAGTDTLAEFENLTGSAFNDVLTDDGANNILSGLGGDDRLFGSAGNDKFDGGAGNDTLDYSNVTGGVGVTVSLATGAAQATGGAGTDTIVLGSVENLVGTAFNDKLTGASTGAAIHNRIDAGDGDDEVNGGLGNDILIGGAGNDTASYVGTTGAVTVNLATGIATGAAGNDTLSGFENVIGSTGADRLTGDGGDNILTGNAGNDVLDGGAGNDTAVYSTATAAVTVNLVAGTASGGAGADTLVSIENAIGSNFADTFIVNGGDNVLDGGGNNDTVNYANAAAAVTVDLAIAGPQDTGGAGTDTLISIENATGSDFNDVLIGNAGINVLSGGAGDDRLFGSLGNDRLDGGTGVDTADYSLIGAGVTVSLALGTAQNTVGAGFDTLVANTIENLVGTGSNDRLTGNTANNVIEGGGGDDIMDGGAGIDTASYESAAQGVTVNLALAVAQNTEGAGTDTLANFENLIGSAFNDRLTSNGNANVLSGLAGDDTLSAGGGNDTLSGGAGNDTLLGGTGDDAIDGGADLDTASYADIAGSGVTVSLAIAIAQNTGAGGVDTLNDVENLTGSGGNDHLTGNAGDNVLDGGAGNDTLIGGAGNDTGRGGLGDDTYTYTVGDGDDIVNDEGGTDELLLTSPALASVTNAKWTGNDLVLTFTDDGTVTVQDHFAGTGRAVETGRDSTNAILNLATSLAGGAGNDLVAGTDGGETVDGGAGDDVIFANDGDDTVIGGADDDLLFGGRGNDTYQYSIGDGVDLIREHDQGDLGGDDQVFFADSTFEGLDAGVRRDGDDFVVSVFGGGELRLQDHFADHVIETARDSSGEVKYLATTLDGGANNDVVADDDDSETLTGGAGDDVLFANGGNDTLVGGTGNDDLLGGSGNDTYRFRRGDGHDVIIDDGVGDTDTLVLVSSGGLSSATRVGNDLVLGLYANTGSVTDENHYAGGTLERIVFERGLFPDGTPFDLEINDGTSFDGIGDPDELFVGTAADETFTLGDGHDTVFAGAGNDTIDGGTGDDWIEGGAGADHIIGGSDGGFVWIADVASYRNSSAGVTIDLQADTASGGDADGDNLDGIEGLAGSQFDDVLRGGVDDGREVFFGNGGNDTIDGRTGMDRVDYRGDIEHAEIDLGGGHVFTGVYVNLATSVAYDGFGGTDSLTSIEQVVGSDFNDVLLGGNPASDAFELFRGREGDDIIDGGAGFDEADYSTSIAGISADLGTGVVLDGFGFTDRLANIEAINGSFFADTMQGSDTANETFRGLLGNDTIDGGASLGDAVDYRQDVFFGGLGAVTVNLATGTAIDGFGHTDTLSDIEVVFGTQFSDTLSGGNAGETFVGGAGNDVIAGGLGNDVYRYTPGADGNDTVSDAGGNDQVLLSIDFDDFDAGVIRAGNDLFINIVGGGQLRLLNHYAAGQAIETVRDAAGEVLHLATSLNGGGDNDVVAGTDGSETLTGGAGDDVVFGNGGNDVLDGGTGDDELFGGSGNDLLLGGGGNDHLEGGSDDDRYIVRRLGGTDSISDEGGSDTLSLGFTNLGLADVRRSGDDLVFDLIDGTNATVLGHYAGASIETVEIALTPGYESLGSFSIVTGTAGTGANEIIIGDDDGETITGGGGVNYVFGHGGNDTITGGSHDDFIDGGAGADTINGGSQSGFLAGGDFVLYSSSDAAVTVDLGSAGPQSGGHAQGDLLSNIEGVVGSIYDDVLTGRSTASDRFVGNAGNDTIAGLGGFDQVEYGDSPGPVAVNFSGAAETVDLGAGPVVVGAGQALDGFGDTDTLSSIEGVRGGAFNDVLIGSDRTDVVEYFRGRGGDNFIDGRGGLDEVSYAVNFAPGGVNLTGELASVSVNLDTVEVLGIAAGTALVSNGFTDTLVGIEYVEASLRDDILIGSAADNRFRALQGDDYVDGRAGDEDAIDYRLDSSLGGTGAVTVDLAAGTAIDGWGDTDTLTGIEGIFATAGNDTLLGSNGSQIEFFFGGTGNDLIDGRGGFDQVHYSDAFFNAGVFTGVGVNLAAGKGYGGGSVLGQAGAGLGTDTLVGIEWVVGSNFNDILIGDGGSNRLRGLLGDDILDGGWGIDEADYAYTSSGFFATNGVTVDLGLFGPQNTVGAGTDTLVGIENLRGTNGDDVLTGDGGDNRIRGLGGNDVLSGGAGFGDLLDYSQDALFGGMQGVTVNLETGEATDGFGDTDTISDFELVTGTQFDDVLIGSNSTSILEAFRGGAGNDLIDGGTDFGDEARYGLATSAVTINLGPTPTLGLDQGEAIDGQGGTDTLISIESVEGSAFNDIIIAGDPTNDGFERLRGFEGDDYLDGGTGFDEVDYARLRDQSPAFAPVTVDLSIAGAQDTGSAGSDTLVNIEAIRATMGDDMLTGSDGNNRFRGLGGNDTIDGGLGVDQVDYLQDVNFGGFGGIGVVLYNGVATDGFGHVDTLTRIENVRGTNFGDSFIGDAEANEFQGLRGDDYVVGLAGADVLLGGDEDSNTDVDTLDYSSDAGWGGTAGVTVDLANGFAIDGFGHTDTISGFEFVIGTGENDRLIGSDLNKREYFRPGLGNDYVDGGVSGPDVLVYDDVGAAVTVNLAITTPQDTGGAGIDTLSNINHVRGTAFDDRLTGNPNDNRFWGLEGNDLFDGGVTGDDIADYGLDALYGGSGGVSVDLRTDTAIDGFGDTDTLTNIRSVIGTGADDILIGSSEVNRLNGSAGDDYLVGLAGWDELHAEDGGRDVLDYSLDAANGGTSGVIVDLGAGTARDGWGDTDSLRGFEIVIGTQFGDTLFGSDDASVVERFLPGIGADHVDGGGGTDVVDYSHNNAGGVTVNLDGSYAIDWTGATDDLFNIENVIGTDFDDVLIGDDWDNVFRGGAGTDTINGGDGALGGDYGFDTVDYAYYDGPGLIADNVADHAVTVDLGAGTASGFQIGNDTLLNIDAVRGTNSTINGGDLLTGSGGDNLFIGLAGDDTIAGGLGFDTVDYSQDASFGGFFGVSVDLAAAGPNATDGFGDADTLTSIEAIHGTDFADTIVGGAEANTFDGRGGDDVIDGGGGSDTLTGGWGNDTLVFAGAFGDDTVTDFQAGQGSEDQIDLSAFSVDFDTLTFTQVGADTVITSAAFGAGNTITLSNVQAVRLHEDDFIFQGI